MLGPRCRNSRFLLKIRLWQRVLSNKFLIFHQLEGCVVHKLIFTVLARSGGLLGQFLLPRIQLRWVVRVIMALELILSIERHRIRGSRRRES